jgi:hypothetical protein
MANLVRIFAAEHGTTVADISHDTAHLPDIVLQVEASAAEFANGAMYRVGGWVRNKRTGAVIELGPINGNLTDAGWPDRNANIVFPFPAAMAVQADDIIELEGYVRVGAAIAGADAHLAASEFLFVV